MASLQNEAAAATNPAEGSPEPNAEREDASDSTESAENNVVDAPVGKLERIVGQTVRRELLAVYSGPLPPAGQMAQYDAVVSGSAKIIIDEFQANGKHQREMELTALTGDLKQSTRAQWMACGLVLVGFALILALALLKATVLACVVAGTLLVAVISGFLTVGREGTSHSAEDMPKPSDTQSSGDSGKGEAA